MYDIKDLLIGKKAKKEWKKAQNKKEVVEMKTSMDANIGIANPGMMGMGSSMGFNDSWEKITKKKKKKDGETANGVPMKEQEVIATVQGDSDYGGFSGGWHYIEQLVRNALRDSKKYGEWPDTYEIFDDKIYVGVYDNLTRQRRFFEVEYDYDDQTEKVTLGDATEIEKFTQWVIKEQADRVARGLFPMTEDLLEEAKWTAAFIGDLPDSSFAVISAGGKKDADGKTTPRDLRHLPYKDADGKVDLPHLRNALARLDQADLTADEKKKAQTKLDKAAKDEGIGQ